MPKLSAAGCFFVVFLLAGCGGGGASPSASTTPVGIPNTTPFPVNAPITALNADTQTITLTGIYNGATISDVTSSVRAVATQTFLGQVANTVVNTNTVSQGGMPFSSSATTSYFSLNPYKNIAASGVGIYTEYANQAALPTSATIGMSGSMDTGTDYTDSSKTVVLDTFVETWSLLAGATPSTANLCTKIVYKAVAATATSGTLTGCLTIDSSGNILGLQLTTPIGLNMVTLKSTSIVTLPSEPTISSVTPGAGSATVNLVAPTKGGAPITNYTVTATPSALTLLGNITITGATSPITIGNLTAGVPYTFTATASNILGAGVASAASYPVTPTVGPAFYVASTLAGSPASVSASGIVATSSVFSTNLSQVAVDGSGNVYVADTNNNQIRKISSTGVVSTLAGSGSVGSANGTGTAASFNLPRSVAVDASGNIFVADTGNSLIRMISAAGVVTTFAGSGTAGGTNGTGTAASFYTPYGIAVDSIGNVYVADTGSSLIRKITSAGVVSTLAGTYITIGSVNGTGAAALFSYPQGIAVDAGGNVYVTDTTNNMIRKITAAGVVTTLAGSTIPGKADGVGVAASFNSPTGIAVDGAGNVYVADSNNAEIRLIAPTGVVSTFAATGKVITTNGTSSVALSVPVVGLAVDNMGNVYISESNAFNPFPVNFIVGITKLGFVP